MDEVQDLEGMLVQGWSAFLMQNDETTWTAVVKALTEACQDDPYVLLDVELWGAAINRADPDATAFPYRDAVYEVGILVVVPATVKHAHAIFEEQVARIQDIWETSLVEYLEGTYVNYAMKSLDDTPDSAKITYGDNLERLQKVKTMYDPNNVFHRPQSIPL